MKRPARTILIFLLLSVAINVIIGFTAGIWGEQIKSSHNVARPSFDPELAAIADKIGISPQGYAQIGYEWDMITRVAIRDWLQWTNDEGTFSTDKVLFERFRIGLPFKSFELTRRYEHEKGQKGQFTQRFVTSDDRDSLMPERMLPGFFANVLIYALGLWFLFQLPRWIDLAFMKKRYRIMRGCCPTCGYDLQKNLEGGCSECGWNRGESSANDTEK